MSNQIPHVTVAADERYAAEKLVLAGRIIQSRTHSLGPLRVAMSYLNTWAPDNEPRFRIEELALTCDLRRRSVRRSIAYLVAQGFLRLVDENGEGIVLRPNFALIAEDAARKRIEFDESPAEPCVAFREAA